MSRFALEWLVPGRPDRLTHVMLLDRERPAPFVVAVGYGADRVHALLSLWRTLINDDESAEAIEYVADECAHRAGTLPHHRDEDNN
jgi:hypothetical protein